MLKVFGTQKAFSGFSSIIPSLFSTILPYAPTARVNYHFSRPFLHFSFLLQVMPQGRSTRIALIKPTEPA